VRSRVRLVRIALLAALCSTRLHGQAESAVPPLIGRLIPTFAWPSMQDSTVTISPLTFAGRVVLIDLWATWCAPCRREMPFLHEAYAKYHALGLEILSISFDASPGNVEKYRRGEFPMPWHHVFAGGPIESEATRLFQVDNFPRTVLVDRSGTVLRVDVGLRGPALLATVDSVVRGQTIAPLGVTR
jgi:thiol-disulfide isomerase/thioredoxin